MSPIPEVNYMNLTVKILHIPTNRMMIIPPGISLYSQKIIEIVSLQRTKPAGSEEVAGQLSEQGRAGQES